MTSLLSIWNLFFTFFKIGIIGFGGGMAILPMIYQSVLTFSDMAPEEFANLFAISQATPGPIAVNAAILAGRRIAGWPGMLAAVLGTLIPPVVIIGAISLIYAQFAANEWVRAAMAGMSCGVAAVISDVVFGLGGKVVRKRDWLNIALMLLAFVLTYFLRVNVVFIILGAAVVGVVRSLLPLKGGDGA